MFRPNDVIQFNENHKWAGCLGLIHEIKHYEHDIRYMVGVPVPEGGTAFIFVMESDNAIEYIGYAILVIADSKNEE